MAIDAAVFKSRVIRETILQLLHAAHTGCPDVWIPFGQVARAFTGGKSTYKPEEIQAELIDLIDDKLIVHQAAARDANGLEKAYQITSAGRDFHRARYPWSRVDEYTGRQGLPDVTGR